MHDVFTVPSRRKLSIYACLLLAFAAVTWAYLVVIDADWWFATAVVAAILLLVAGGFGSWFWLVSGPQQEAVVAGRKTVVPTRLWKALPYFVTLFVIIQLLRLLELTAAR